MFPAASVQLNRRGGWLLLKHGLQEAVSANWRGLVEAEVGQEVGLHKMVTQTKACEEHEGIYLKV